MRTLNVFSFGDVYPIGGVHTWNVRLASYFGQNLEHEIRWTVVEVGDTADLEQLRAGIPASVSAQYRLLEAKASYNPFSDARSLLKALPELETAHVVIPNLRPTGYMVWDTLRRAGIAPPPALIGVLHSDEEFYYRQCANAVVGSHDLVVAVSAACEEQFGTRRPDVPLIRIAYGVEIPEHLHPKPEGGKIQIAYVGRIIQHQKRALDIANVIEELVKQGTAFELHVLGDGPERAELEKRLAKFAPGQFKFHGPLLLPSVLEFLRHKAHVSILVSEWEGTSIAMLEAMANGVVPVITDVNSGSREVIRQGVEGWRLPVGAASEMAEVISMLARDRTLLKRVANQAYQTARDRYSLERSAMQWGTAIRSAIGTPRSAMGINRNHFRLGRLQRPGIPSSIVGFARNVRRIACVGN